MFRRILAAAIVCATPALADQHQSPDASAEVSGPDGIKGTVTLTDTASGNVVVGVDLTGVPEGTHGIHLHETGDCSAGDFSSAGGHIPGNSDHGTMSATGPHPGDLPNAHVGSDGVLNVEHFNPLLDIAAMVMDDDGAAFIVHSGADDYTSQPSGDAGSRIACGVFEAT